MLDPDIRSIREHLGLTQAEFATLVGFSVRTIQSCEQGWRHPSPSLEKMVLLLYIARQQGNSFGRLACWETIKCPEAHRDQCIAYQTGQGHLCWFLTGNLSCAQKPLKDWAAKKRACSHCAFFHRLQEAAAPVEADSAAEHEPEPFAVRHDLPPTRHVAHSE